MRRIQRNKKALSTVVTTLIILVVSVLLAGVVTLYATNITATRTQQEQLKLTKQRVWVNATGSSWAGISIDNVGGKDVAITKIQIRGVEASWSNVRILRLSTSVTTSLICPTGATTWSDFLYTTGTNGTFSTPTTSPPLKSGDTMVVYVIGPDSINLSDVGIAVGITVFTEQTQYYVEANAETSVSA